MSYLDRIEQRMTQPAQTIQPAADGSRFFGEEGTAGGMLGGLFDAFSGPRKTKRDDLLTASNSIYACITGRATLLKALPLKVYRFDTATQRKTNRKERRRLARQLAQGMAAEWSGQLVDDDPLTTAANIRNVIGRHQRAMGGIGLEEIHSGPVVDLLTEVNPFWTCQRLIENTEMSLGLWGKSFWLLDYKGGRYPVEIMNPPGKYVKPIPDPVNYIKHFEYQPPGRDKPIIYNLGEVVWFNYADPRDMYGSLSPLAAAEVYAQYEKDAMAANSKLFTQGFQIGGVVFPGGGKSWKPDQAGKVEAKIDKRAKGKDRAHTWAVFEHEVDFKPWTNITPKDMDFLGGLGWTLESACRAYKWPLDLVGGRRTYQNQAAAMLAAYTQAVLPEASMIAGELVEQLIPIFEGAADFVAFDASAVAELQEAETEKWRRFSEQIQAGAATINEWRLSQGLEPFPWGDTWYAPGGLVPIDEIGNTERAQIRVIEPAKPLGLPEPDTTVTDYRAAIEDAPNVVMAYYEEMIALTQAASDGEIEQGDYLSTIRDLTRNTLEAAFLEGAEADSLADLDTEAIIEFEAEALEVDGWAEGLAADVYDGKFREDRPTEEGKPHSLLSRLAVWGYAVLGAIGLGQLFNRKDPMLEWNYDSSKEHCNDCARLHGQRHKASDWKASGWRPQSRGLECKGYACGCRLLKSRGKAKGDF